MDWTKAKTILIVALLVTNLFLLGAYLTREMREVRADEGILREILASENVVLETELPKSPRSMAVLYVKPENADPAWAETLLAQGEIAAGATASEVEILAAVDAVLRDSGVLPATAQVVLPLERPNGKIVVRYRNLYRDIPIEESYIACTVENGRITELDRRWYTPVDLHNKNGAICTPAEALMQLLPAKDQAETLVVKQVELVYWVNPEGMGAESPVGDTALPAWKVVAGDGRAVYITAYE